MTYKLQLGRNQWHSEAFGSCTSIDSVSLVAGTSRNLYAMKPAHIREGDV